MSLSNPQAIAERVRKHLVCLLRAEVAGDEQLMKEIREDCGAPEDHEAVAAELRRIIAWLEGAESQDLVRVQTELAQARETARRSFSQALAEGLDIDSRDSNRFEWAWTGKILGPE